MKNVSKVLILSLVFLALYDCARKGRPSGGPKDETAPILVVAKPPNETTDFNANEIRIYFDEYVILKDLTKQLVVSPPLKNPPLITPQGTPSKYINIKILDTLKPNTTYTFNFGNAVQDNNENNKLESFKYVFSTGKYIDSLTLKGNIKDALEKKSPKEISVLLYKLDSTFKDSTIYKEKPLYVASTIDSSNYNFSNLQNGKYILVALKQSNRDFIYNPKSDKIAFSLDTISLPKDSIISTDLTLFREIQPYKFKRGKEVKKGKIEFGFNGKQKDMKVKLLSKVPEDYTSFSQFHIEKDTLNYWYTPLEKDSLNFIISNLNTIDTTTVFLRKKKIDSLSVSSTIRSVLNFNDTLFFTTNNPIIKIDSSKFSLIDKDTLNVPFKLKKQTINKIAFLFDKKPSDKYKIQVLPNAFVDLYNTTNDTINSKFSTKTTEDYGSIILDIANRSKQSIIIELLSSDEKVISKKYVNDISENVKFNLLSPQNYKVRAIIDVNKNNKWDTGNFLLKIQPEIIIYFESELNVRANWILNESFTIK